MTTSYRNAHARERVAFDVLRYLDLIVIAVGVLVALALGAPALGLLIGIGGWFLQRGLQALDRRATARVSDSLRRAGTRLAEAFGRIWLLAGAIVAAALLGGHDDGLAATLTIFAAYTVAFVLRLTSGRPAPREIR